MKTKRHHRGASNTRRGLQALELLFAVPVLAVLLLTALQCGKAMMVRSGVVQAATVAAREAGKGAGIDEVTQAVNCILAAHGIAVTGRPGSGTKVAVQNGRGIVRQYGDPHMVVLPAPATGGDETLATLWIKFDAKRTDGRKLLASSCGVLGLAFGEGRLSASSVVKK
jgi:Flp pilus assembly protein TadG